MSRPSKCVDQHTLNGTYKSLRTAQTPIGYHYANQPTKSVDRVRDVVFSNFDISMLVYICSTSTLLAKLVGQLLLAFPAMMTKQPWPPSSHSTF